MSKTATIRRILREIDECRGGETTEEKWLNDIGSADWWAELYHQDGGTPVTPYPNFQLCEQVVDCVCGDKYEDRSKR